MRNLIFIISIFGVGLILGDWNANRNFKSDVKNMYWKDDGIRSYVDDYFVFRWTGYVGIETGNLCYDRRKAQFIYLVNSGQEGEHYDTVKLEQREPNCSHLIFSK